MTVGASTSEVRFCEGTFQVMRTDIKRGSDGDFSVMFNQLF